MTDIFAMTPAELKQHYAKLQAEYREPESREICRMAGHDWSRSYEMREQPGMLWRKCQRCGAEETSPRPERKETILVLADCGHRVLPSQIMGTSTGSSCPDCYDRMSS
jgi:hypothetical protein